jgi:hypothetical protein
MTTITSSASMMIRIRIESASKTLQIICHSLERMMYRFILMAFMMAS